MRPFAADADGRASLEEIGPARTEMTPPRPADSSPPRKTLKHAEKDGYNANPELENVG